MDIRDAEADELPQLARLWRDAWLDGHEAIAPAELTALRTVASVDVGQMAGGIDFWKTEPPRTR